MSQEDASFFQHFISISTVFCCIRQADAINLCCVALWQHDRPSSDKEGHRAQIDRLSVLMSASKRHCGKRWGIGPRVRAMDLYKTHAVIHIGVHSTIEIPSRWDRTSEKRFLLQGDFSPANNFTNLDY